MYILTLKPSPVKASFEAKAQSVVIFLSKLRLEMHPKFDIMNPSFLCFPNTIKYLIKGREKKFNINIFVLFLIVRYDF